MKEYEKLHKIMCGNDVVLFADGCYPVHTSVPDYGWIRKGRELKLKANTSRRRLNINGAYDVDRFEWNDVFLETVNAQSTCELFDKIEKKFPAAGQIIYFVITRNITNCGLFQIIWRVVESKWFLCLSIRQT